MCWGMAGDASKEAKAALGEAWAGGRVSLSSLLFDSLSLSLSLKAAYRLDLPLVVAEAPVEDVQDLLHAVWAAVLDDGLRHVQHGLRWG